MPQNNTGVRNKLNFILRTKPYKNKNEILIVFQQSKVNRKFHLTLPRKTLEKKGITR